MKEGTSKRGGRDKLGVRYAHRKTQKNAEIWGKMGKTQVNSETDRALTGEVLGSIVLSRESRRGLEG